MLTVKVMSSNGGEEIHDGSSVGFNSKQKSISIAGLDQHIFLKEDEVAYVMNQNGKTVSVYHGS
ncbi:hypothetical protein [Klebsiella phage phiKp_27]|nr:hypothetical protein [Klebsiella phage phiKp_27]